jgi:hypothetical protein
MADPETRKPLPGDVLVSNSALYFANSLLYEPPQDSSFPRCYWRASLFDLAKITQAVVLNRKLWTLPSYAVEEQTTLFSNLGKADYYMSSMSTINFGLASDTKKSELPESEKTLSAGSRTLKLFLVSCFGVTVRIHGLASPLLAEAITAYGRHVLQSTWDMAKERELKPKYGDTDSVFLDNPRVRSIQTAHFGLVLND